MNFLFAFLVPCWGSQLASFLEAPSRLTLANAPGLKLLNSKLNCDLKKFNETVPFGVKCDETYPLYFDSERHTHFGTDVLTEAHLEFAGKLVMRHTDQWALVHLEDLEGVQAEGWNANTITECAGVLMLGGYCQFAAQEVFKDIIGLPDHEMVRVRALFYFIDEWRGETGYLKLEGEYVWTHTYDLNNVKEAENICGATDKWEGKFGESIDVRFAHSEEALRAAFGSTLDDQPCEKSWGISGFEVYVR